MTHRSLSGTLKLRSVLHQRSEGHVWRRVECFGPWSSRWSGDGGVRLTVSPSYSHSHGPLPERHNTERPNAGTGLWHQPSIHYCPPQLLFYRIATGMLIPLCRINTHQMPSYGKDTVTLSTWKLVFKDKWINSQTDGQQARWTERQIDNRVRLSQDP